MPIDFQEAQNPGAPAIDFQEGQLLGGSSAKISSLGSTDPRLAGQYAALEDIKRNQPKLAGAAISTAATGAMGLPGVGPFTGAGIAAGGTTLSQLLGLEPKDVGQVALSGAIPLAVPGILGMVKGGLKGALELINPSAMRRAGSELGAIKMGTPATSLERVYTAPASQAAFAAAKGVGFVPSAKISEAMDNAIFNLRKMANPDAKAMQYLKNIADKFRDPSGQAGRFGIESNAATYDDIMREMQQLNGEISGAFSRGDHVTAQNLKEARAAAMAALDSISPEVSRANKLFVKELAHPEVMNALRTQNSTQALEKLFEQDPLMKKAFDKETYAALQKVAESISGITTSPAGLAGRIFQAVVSPVARNLDKPPARAMMRQLMEPTGKLSATGFSTLAQFLRAYEATNE